MKLFNFLGFKTENSMINAQLESEVAWPFPTSERPKSGESPAPELTIPMQPGKLTVDPRMLEKDPSGRPLHQPGAKADAGKLRPWLVLGQFSHALEEVTKVGTAGAKKYTDNGWLSVENAESRYMDAFARHMLEVGKGNQMDDGPNGVGTMHLANMVWNLLAVLELQLRNEKSSSKA